MTYDFDTIMNRRGKDALAVDAIGAGVDCDLIQNEFDGIEVSKPEGTYMLFLHCEEYCKKHNLTIDKLIQSGWDVGVAWQQGAPFHDEWGIRMNLAVPYSLVTEAFSRLKRFVFVY